MSDIQTKIDAGVARINEAITTLKPIKVFGLYSGGHDSFSACWCASKAIQFDGCVHINTGIGVEATRDHVRETCAAFGWLLIEKKAVENIKANGQPDPQIYEDIVLKHGFPGGFAHRMMYVRLKERCLAMLARDYSASGKKKDPRRIMLISGARQQESERRMGTTRQVQIDGKRVWVSPILDWTKLDTSSLIEHVGAKRNPIVDLIHKSGECLCGAFAAPGELKELSLWPQTRPAYERIMALQSRVKEAGFPWGWEDGPPKSWLETKRGQMDMFTMPLCWSCTKGKAA